MDWTAKKLLLIDNSIILNVISLAQYNGKYSYTVEMAIKMLFL